MRWTKRDRVTRYCYGNCSGIKPAADPLDESQVDAWFGWFAPFTALDLRASSAWTRERLQWQPVGPGLLEDLRNMDYQKVTLSR